MREILFKAKRIDNGEWVEGMPVFDGTDEQWRIVMQLDYSTGTCIQTEYAPRVIAKTICQYTGLCDKNRRKIWENDIVKYHFGDNVAPIRFGEYQSCFDSIKAGHIGFYVDWDSKKALRKDLGYWVNLVDCNVIGNAFDNPELLEGGK